LVEIDRITVARPIGLALEKILIIGVIMQFVKSSREAKVGKFDMSTTIKQDVIGFDVTSRELKGIHKHAWNDLPVNISCFMNSFDGEHNLGDVKTGYILRKDLILDQHCHEISSGQELHQHIEEVGVLKGGVELHYP
jgi:hypothetical protein